MTSLERAEKAADDWRRADGVTPIVPFIQDAIEAAVAAERSAVRCLLAAEIMSWMDGNDPKRDVAIEALRIFGRLVPESGAK